MTEVAATDMTVSPLEKKPFHSDAPQSNEPSQFAEIGTQSVTETPDAKTPPTNYTNAEAVTKASTPPTTAGAAQSTAAASLLVPTLTSLTPNTIAKGSANANVAIVGTNFDPSSVVYVGGVPVKTTYNSPTSLTALFSHSTVVSAGAVACYVQNVNMLAKSGTSNFTYT